MQAFGLCAVNLMEIHAIKLGLRGLQAQLMLPRLGLRQIERTGLEHATGLARFLFERVIEIHRIMLDPADIGTVMQTMDIGRGVPGGP